MQFFSFIRVFKFAAKIRKGSENDKAFKGKLSVKQSMACRFFGVELHE